MGNTTHYVGVDPGKSGAFALIAPSGALISIYDMPIENRQPCPYGVAEAYRKISRSVVGNVFVMVEKPHTRPTDGKKGIASYHLGAGYLMMPILWHWRVQMIQPTIWTKEMHQGQPQDLSAKRKSKAAFQVLFPKLANSEAFIDDKIVYDGRIDALLIAEYARRMHNGITHRFELADKKSKE